MVSGQILFCSPRALGSWCRDLSTSLVSPWLSSPVLHLCPQGFALSVMQPTRSVHLVIQVHKLLLFCLKEHKYSCSPTLATFFVVAFVVDHCPQVSLMTLSPSISLSYERQVASKQCSLNCVPGNLWWGRPLTPPHESQRCKEGD